MNLFVLCVLYSLIPYIYTDPAPDSIQIQNYDGPIFLNTPRPNCCPLCNSLLTQPAVPDPCDAIPEEYLRKTQGTNDVPFPNITPFGNDPSNACTPVASGNKYGTAPENSYCAPGNTDLGSMLHKYAGKSPGVTFSVPLTTSTLASSGKMYGTAGNGYTTTAGMTIPLTASGNVFTGAPTDNTYNTQGTSVSPFCGTVPPTITGTECTCTCVTKPLSSYLPINTSQNTCYKVPIANNQVFGDDEPVLVPQKFSYALVLDGDVAPFNNRQCDCRCYCYC